MGQLELYTRADEHTSAPTVTNEEAYIVWATMQKAISALPLALFLFAAQPLGIRRRAHYALNSPSRLETLKCVSRRAEAKTLIE